MLDFLFSIFFISLIVLPQLFIGTAAALLAWLPPVRRLCWRSLVARRAVIGLLACVSFAVSFGLCTKMSAEIDYVFASPACGCYPGATPLWPPKDQVKYQPVVIRELWQRYLIPPPLRTNCYSSVATVCELANHVTARPSAQAWKQYGINLGLSLIAGAANSSLVWLLTRKRVVQVPEPFVLSS
jgi:hypothetical protein